MLLVYLLACALVFLFGCGKQGDSAAKPEDHAADPARVEISTAAIHSMEETLTIQGVLSPAQGYSVKVAAMSPARIRSILVREGERVHSGQLVAVLENGLLQAQQKSAQSALSSASALANQSNLALHAAQQDHTSALALGELALTAAKLDRESSVKQAQIGLELARTDLAKLRAGARKQEIVQAELTVKQAQVNSDRAASEDKRTSMLFEKGVDSRRQLEDAHTAVQVANAALASVQQQLSLIKVGARSEDLNSAVLRVTQAEELFNLARESGTTKVTQAETALTQAKQGAVLVAMKSEESRAGLNTATQKKADLESAKVASGYSELKSPIDGIVVRRNSNPGDMADPATPLLEIGSSSSLNLVCNISAEEGAKLKPGMISTIYEPAIPGLDLKGSVITVGQVDPQTNLMKVRLSADNHEGTARPGAYLSAVVVLRTNSHAVVVPAVCVVQKEGKDGIFQVSADGVAHFREIHSGAAGKPGIEIIEGVKAGDRVVSTGQYELSDGAKVEVAEPKPEAAPPS